MGIPTAAVAVDERTVDKVASYLNSAGVFICDGKLA